MNRNNLFLLFMFSVIFSSCKKEEQQREAKDFELSLVKPSVNLQVKPGDEITSDLVLLEHGREVSATEFTERGGTSRIRIVDGPQHVVNGGLGFNNNRLWLQMIIPVVDGPVTYAVDLYMKGAWIVSLPLSFNIALPTTGWIPRNFMYINDVYETKEGKVYFIDYFTLYKADSGLNNLEKNNSSMEDIRFFGAKANKVYAYDKGGRLMISDNEGATFRQRPTGITGLQYAALLDNGEIIVASADSALFTDDEGLSWKPFKLPSYVYKIRTLADQSILIFAGKYQMDKALYYLEKAGAKPKQLKFPTGMMDVEVVNNSIYLLTDNEVYRSVNKGTSFETMGTIGDNQGFYDLQTDGKHLVINSRTRFYVTQNVETMQALKEGEISFPSSFGIRALSGNKLVALPSENYVHVLTY